MGMKRATYESLRDWRARSAAKYQARPRKAAEKPQESPQRARKREADAEYRRNREQRLVRAGGRCEYMLPESDKHGYSWMRCERTATQTHHVQRRSNGVDHSVENLRCFCLWHHQEIHLNVEAAKSAGWIKATWQQLERRDA